MRYLGKEGGGGRGAEDEVGREEEEGIFLKSRGCFRNCTYEAVCMKNVINAFKKYQCFETTRLWFSMHVSCITWDLPEMS